jgi:Ca2+-binding EF-hand superfamily protein
MKISGQGWNAQDAAARHEEMFGKLDRDGDKKITKDEMKAAMSERGGGAKRAEGGPSLDEMFSRIDTNEDGAIDQDEHKAFASSLASRRPQGPPDYDKSGAVTVSTGESRTLGVA